MISTEFSIRNGRVAILLALATGLSFSTGCVRMSNTPPEAISQEPLLVDDAMQLRDWEPSTAYYANGDVVAGPTLFPYRLENSQPDCRSVAVEPVLIVGETAALPITALVVPAWKSVAWTGVTYEPTYTAQPPLPDDTEIELPPPLIETESAPQPLPDDAVSEPQLAPMETAPE